MKIVFVSNRLTPHQIPLCNEFLKQNEFYFVETMKDEFFEIGWRANGEQYSYVLPYTEEHDKVEKIQRTIFDADVVIIGSAPDTYIKRRLRSGKITFRYTERFYKNGITVKNFIRILIGTWLHHGRFQKYPLYVLCASAYTACDCNIFKNYKNKLFKWGYFPETRYYNIDELLENKSKSKLSILWVGRLVKYKHPEVAIRLANELIQHDYNVELNIVGYGPLESKLYRQIVDLNLEERIHLIGGKRPNEVREYMENSDIFLLTSDFNEGWGAVLNEAMNSGCVPVASHAVGATPFLIKHGVNGMIYKNGDENDLFKNVKSLLDNPQKMCEIQKKAYHTIVDMWCAEVAVKRFLELYDGIKKRKDINTLMYDDGPCSEAKVISQKDMHSFVLSKSREVR